jgi:hypothetical protein
MTWSLEPALVQRDMGEMEAGRTASTSAPRGAARCQGLCPVSLPQSAGLGRIRPSGSLRCCVILTLGSSYLFGVLLHLGEELPEELAEGGPLCVAAIATRTCDRRCGRQILRVGGDETATAVLRRGSQSVNSELKVDRVERLPQQHSRGRSLAAAAAIGRGADLRNRRGEDRCQFLAASTFRFSTPRVSSPLRERCRSARSARGPPRGSSVDHRQRVDCWIVRGRWSPCSSLRIQA